MMTRTIAAALAVTLLTESATGCGKRKKKSRWDSPETTQTQQAAYPVCWSDLSNLPCVVEQDAGKGVLHLPATVTGVQNTRPVLLIQQQENGNWRVEPA